MSKVNAVTLYANMTDLDLFRLLSRTVSFIEAWEKATAPPLIRAAKKAIAERQEGSVA